MRLRTTDRRAGICASSLALWIPVSLSGIAPEGKKEGLLLRCFDLLGNRIQWTLMAFRAD